MGRDCMESDWYSSTPFNPELVMSDPAYAQQQAPAKSDNTPAAGKIQARPFALATTATTPSLFSDPNAELQAKLDHGKRFGYNLRKTTAAGSTPPTPTSSSGNPPPALSSKFEADLAANGLMALNPPARPIHISEQSIPPDLQAKLRWAELMDVSPLGSLPKSPISSAEDNEEYLPVDTVQRQSDRGTVAASPDIESSIASKRGSGSSIDDIVIQRDESSSAEDASNIKLAFVRKDTLNLHESPAQQSPLVATLKFGQRVHILEENPQFSWQKVVFMGKVGYVDALKIHSPPAHLIQKDPGLSLIRVKSGETFWSLVKRIYGIQGNEGDKDQNINHFINAIRAFNKPEAFKVKTDMLDDIGNFFLSGRDATDTYLIAGVDLWIPSFGVAARMDVGSGTVRGEISRFINKIEQKLKDFKTACQLSVQFIPDSISRHAGALAGGLLKGLIQFAKEAAIILATSTAVGALIGSIFGGVGAIPGAEIGFEIGLLILKMYGLYMLIEAVLKIATNLLSKLGEFIKLAWTANGDKKQLEQAGQSLAEALGILVSAVMVAVAAYIAKRGINALKKTKFAKTVGETSLVKWINQRQKLQTAKGVYHRKLVQSILSNPSSIWGKTHTQIEPALLAEGWTYKPYRGTSKAYEYIKNTKQGRYSIVVNYGGGRHTHSMGKTTFDKPFYYKITGPGMQKTKVVDAKIYPAAEIAEQTNWRFIDGPTGKEIR